jgi:hypothetical protein
MSKEVKLPSGAILKITLSPFKDAKALYQAMLEEAKTLKLDPHVEIDTNLYTDLFCAALSSKRIETALWECMKRVTYNDLKISDDTFEPEAARDDYLQVCFEVAKENVQPFMKALMQQYSQVLNLISKPPA